MDLISGVAKPDKEWGLIGNIDEMGLAGNGFHGWIYEAGGVNPLSRFSICFYHRFLQ